MTVPMTERLRELSMLRRLTAFWRIWKEGGAEDDAEDGAFSAAERAGRPRGRRAAMP